MPGTNGNEIGQNAAETAAKKRPPPVRLTPREIELLEFLLDQKFGSLEALYLRFYFSEGSTSSRYAYHRLSLLQKNGFLIPVRVFTESKYYYLASDLAHAVVQGQRPERKVSPPVSSIDLRTFEHDKRVMLARVHREKKGEVRDWLSERRLKQEWTTESGYRLAKEYMPDAIYTAKAGHRVAFELELAAKTRERLTRKVSRFLEVMKSPNGAFSRTLFVACSEPVYQMLASVTRPYPDLFKVMRYEELVPSKTLKEGG